MARYHSLPAKKSLTIAANVSGCKLELRRTLAQRSKANMGPNRHCRHLLKFTRKKQTVVQQQSDPPIAPGQALRKTNFLLGTVVPFQESHGVGSAKLIGQVGDLQFLERLQVKQLKCSGPHSLHPIACLASGHGKAPNFLE
jgi:hypothetical protein